MPAAQLRQYSIDTLYFSDETVLAEVNADNCLTAYISGSPDYLAIEQPDTNRLVIGFSRIGVSFVEIDYERANKDLFNEVYKLNFYTLTFENIALLLKKVYGVENDSDITHKNFTLIQGFADSPLTKYVYENMDVYSSIILDNCNGYISDDENIAVCFLNNAKTDASAKKRYIELLSTMITDIRQVTEPALWTEMIINGKVIFSENTFTSYFQEHGIDKALTKYINDMPSEVDFTDISDHYGKKTAEELFAAAAVCNAIATGRYKKILLGLGYHFDSFDSFDAGNISDEKINVLIDERILKMDIRGLEFVRSKYAKHIMAFIKQNFDEYMALQNNEIFNLDEALHIITWDISDEKKINLLSFDNEEISIVGRMYSDEVNAYIVLNKLKAEDKPYICANYMQYGEKTRKAISELAVTAVGVKEIIAENMEVDDLLLSIFLQSKDIPYDQKTKLFTLAIPRLNEDTCNIHFDELVLPDFNGIYAKSSDRKNDEKSSDVTTFEIC